MYKDITRWRFNEEMYKDITSHGLRLGRGLGLELGFVLGIELR